MHGQGNIKNTEKNFLILLSMAEINKYVYFLYSGNRNRFYITKERRGFFFASVSIFD